MAPGPGTLVSFFDPLPMSIRVPGVQNNYS